MYEDKLSGVISAEFWKRKYAEYSGQLQVVKLRIKACEVLKQDCQSKAEKIFELAQKAYSMYVRQDPFEKRRILDMVLSNCEIKGGELVAEYAKLFEIIADGVAEEEKLTAQNVPFEGRNQNWLPG